MARGEKLRKRKGRSEIGSRLDRRRPFLLTGAGGCAISRAGPSACG
jgi:hypothetical protein